MQKITPFLWFDTQAEEAANHYVSIFKNSKILQVSRYPSEGGPKKKGTVLTVSFELEGQPFIALNGGPEFKFNESVSFFVDVESQKELDGYWDRLCEGGSPGRCGWLKDKFGLSWQIVPRQLGQGMMDQDPKKAASVMQAMMKMGKLDIKELEAARARG